MYPRPPPQKNLVYIQRTDSGYTICLRKWILLNKWVRKVLSELKLQTLYNISCNCHAILKYSIAVHLSESKINHFTFSHEKIAAIMFYVVVHKSLILQKYPNIFKVIKILSAYCISFFFFTLTWLFPCPNRNLEY